MGKMELTENEKQFLDNILIKPFTKAGGKLGTKVCTNCHIMQSHSLLYCNRCGQKFYFRIYNLKQAMEYFIDKPFFVKGRYTHRKTVRPEYTIACYKRKLDELQIDKKLAIEYLKTQTKWKDDK